MLDTAKKKVLIETWGCQMNVADSEDMLALLANHFTPTDDQNDADLVILNTCHIREKARHKVLSRLGRLKELKTKRPEMRIAVAGCVAQAEGKKLLKAAPQIDVLLGPRKISELPRLLKENDERGTQCLAVGFKNEKTKQTNERPTLSGKNEISRFVNIMQGCNNFCTFCVVPHTRGPEVSRTTDEILAECQTLLRAGAKEITLLGQNVNSYGQDLDESANPFVNLLTKVAELNNLERLRFTTSNPHDFTRPLADLFFNQPKLGRYLHLPVQSGNNEVLERMRRKVTREEFFERVAWLRSRDPEFAISTDLIVGFPGETENQFEQTLDLVEKVRFSFIYAFKYSPRKHTAAIRFKEQVPEEIMSARLKRLNDLQDKITIQLNQAEINQTREVLFLYESQKQAGVYYGRTPQFRLVRVESQRSLVGQTLGVELTSANKTALVGKLI